MRFKSNYIIIPLIAIIIALLGIFADSPDWQFSLFWTIVCATTALAAAIIWNRFQRNKRFWVIMLLFVTNALLMISWIYLIKIPFVGLSLINIIGIELLAIAQIILIWQRSFLVSLLLIPELLGGIYALWWNIIIWAMIMGDPL